MISIANFSGGLIVLVLGLIVRFLKADFLIAGYNTSSEEEKSKYDKDKLTKFVGNMLIVSALCLLIGGIFVLIINKPIYSLGVSWSAFLLIIVSGLIYMNTGNRFKN